MTTEFGINFFLYNILLEPIVDTTVKTVNVVKVLEISFKNSAPETILDSVQHASEFRSEGEKNNRGCKVTLYEVAHKVSNTR